MLEILDLIQDREQCEIHRPHIQRRHFRTGLTGGGQTLVQGHAQPTACCDIHHSIGLLFDAGQEFHEDFRVWRWAAVVWIARMQVQDRRPCFCRSNRIIGNFLGRDRQVFRHAGRMNATGDGAGNNYTFCHLGFLCFYRGADLTSVTFGVVRQQPLIPPGFFGRI